MAKSKFYNKIKKFLFTILSIILVVGCNINCFATQTEVDSLTNVANLIQDSINNISTEIYVLSDRRNFKLKNPRDFYIIYRPITVNSAGGTGPAIKIINGNKKTIKYISFTTKFYNRVNDPVRDEISHNLVSTWNMQGPIPYSDYTGCGSSGWSSLFYNCWANHFVITSLTITYMDGTAKRFTSKQIKNSEINDENDLWYNPSEKRIEDLENKKNQLKEHLAHINKQCKELKTKKPIDKPKVGGLEGYTLRYFPKDKSSVTGTVIVRVTVTPKGDVTKATIVGGSITDEITRTICLGLAQQTTFSVPSHQTIERTGTLTYTIEKDLTSSIEPDDEIFNTAHHMPSFPGGNAALMKYLSDHLRYPQSAADNNIQGKVIVQFVVRKNGSIGEVKVVRGVDKDLDREAIRIIKTLPKFSPGRNANGDPVNVWYTLPFTFKLQGTE